MSRAVATALVVGITLALGGAVAAWLTGFWDEETETELLQLLPGAELEVRNGEVRLFLAIKNEGTASSRIVRIYVERVGEAQLPGDVVIPAGRMWRSPVEGLRLQLYQGAQVMPGELYLVKVVTERGATYHTVARAR
ncbi:MAG: hypothetical protein N3F67_03285 [Acidilobaceae archaeon]|nr:hypothetical protein [Acidilobaceae archaeon]